MTEIGYGNEASARDLDVDYQCSEGIDENEVTHFEKNWISYIGDPEELSSALICQSLFKRALFK